MILAGSQEARQAALDRLLPIQRGDFVGILRAMEGRPVIIRLIDPPLHEFLPSHDELLVQVTEMKDNGVTGPELEEKEKLLRHVESLREMNPMLGLRGVRLGIIMPGINEMQVRAILEAAVQLQKEGVANQPEIMIPLTSTVAELKIMKDLVERVAQQVFAEQGAAVEYKFGTMIEIPRAALIADELAEYAQFFSYGTNDLTQTVFGISRDDAEGKFLLRYVEQGILPENPFQTIDRKGVGTVIQIGVERGRSTRPDLEVGICGEHGGDPSSVEFCHEVGLNYVSCSPFRVPIARLAAAHAALKDKTSVRKDV
jgi:pyruvate,orthophosphate dikinase